MLKELYCQIYRRSERCNIEIELSSSMLRNEKQNAWFYYGMV